MGPSALSRLCDASVGFEVTKYTAQLKTQPVIAVDPAVRKAILGLAALVRKFVNAGPIQQRAPVENGSAMVRSYLVTWVSSMGPLAPRLADRVRPLASVSR